MNWRMEMFPVAAQPILDRYIRGEITEENFLKEVAWEEVWGFPYSLYRDLIDWQKEKRMPVLGLNAPIKVVRKIGHNGLGSLTPDERSQVAREFHLDDPANRLRIRKEYTGRTRRRDDQRFRILLRGAARLGGDNGSNPCPASGDRQEAKCKIVVAIGKGPSSTGASESHISPVSESRTSTGR